MAKTGGWPGIRLCTLINAPAMLFCSFYGNQAGLIKKKKSFTFSESALYLTAKINEPGPGRKATQTCISAQWPVLIGSLLEALIYLNVGWWWWWWWGGGLRWRSWWKVCVCVGGENSPRLLTKPPINNLEPCYNKKKKKKKSNQLFLAPVTLAAQMMSYVTFS